jgi:hypothetical protein
MGKVPNMGRRNSLMKEVQPLPDRHEILKKKECVLTGAVPISPNGVAVSS